MNAKTVELLKRCRERLDRIKTQLGDGIAISRTLGLYVQEADEDYSRICTLLADIDAAIQEAEKCKT